MSQVSVSKMGTTGMGTVVDFGKQGHTISACANADKHDLMTLD